MLQTVRFVSAHLNDAGSALPMPATEKWPQGVWEKEVVRHGTMTVSLFAPRITDYQTPHLQDELYFIIAGRACLTGEVSSAVFSKQQCRPGDVFFVAAGAVHRFEEISEDFASWVTFWGPPGGETDRLPNPPDVSGPIT